MQISLSDPRWANLRKIHDRWVTSRQLLKLIFAQFMFFINIQLKIFTNTHSKAINQDQLSFKFSSHCALTTRILCGIMRHHSSRQREFQVNFGHFPTKKVVFVGTNVHYITLCKTKLKNVHYLGQPVFKMFRIRKILCHHRLHPIGKHIG